MEAILKKYSIQKINSGNFKGKWSDISGHDTIQVTSPIDNKKIAEVTTTTKTEYEETMLAAQDAFIEWNKIPAPKRGDIIRQAVNSLTKHKTSIGKLLSMEVGKTISEGQGEIQEMIDIGNFAAGLSRQIYGLTIASERPNHRMYEQWLPLGTIGVITAFNFPAAVWAWNAFIAAVVGDVVLWKPSSRAPLTAVAVTKIINQIFEEINLKPILFLVVGSGGSIGNLMLNDKRLPLISFTGSVKTGRMVSETVGKRLGRCLLELGGNNACIISNKCNMDVALKGAAFGALATAGQRCTTTRRLIIHESIYDDFVSKLVKIFKNVKVGNPLIKDTLVGPLITENSVEIYLEAIKVAKEQGGKVLCGGKRIKGNYVAPTIIEGKPKMDIICEETFAPLVYVMKYKTMEEAVRIHNSVPQGLSSAIFTSDLHEEEYFLSHKGSDCGIANVNTSTAGAEIGGAFGGEKETGGGRESGSDAWKAYARRQTVTINHGNELQLSQGVKFEYQ